MPLALFALAALVLSACGTPARHQTASSPSTATIPAVAATSSEGAAASIAAINADSQALDYAVAVAVGDGSGRHYLCGVNADPTSVSYGDTHITVYSAVTDTWLLFSIHRDNGVWTVASIAPGHGVQVVAALRQSGAVGCRFVPNVPLGSGYHLVLAPVKAPGTSSAGLSPSLPGSAATPAQPGANITSPSPPEATTATTAFASIDRRETCRAGVDYVECFAAPSRKTVKLQLGVGVTYEGLRSAQDFGGPSLSFGSSRSFAGGRIDCSSSVRGITCSWGDTQFTIGDYEVIVIEGGYGGGAALRY